MVHQEVEDNYEDDDDDDEEPEDQDEELMSDNNMQKNIVAWLGFGLLLLVHALYLTSQVTQITTQLKTDVDYLKSGLSVSSQDRAQLHKDVEILGELKYRLTACEESVRRAGDDFRNHVMKEPKP